MRSVKVLIVLAVLAAYPAAALAHRAPSKSQRTALVPQPLSGAPGRSTCLGQPGGTGDLYSLTRSKVSLRSTPYQRAYSY